jgi:hypothetical protein
MMPDLMLDTRRLHRRRDPERVRYFGKQQSSTELQSPFGQVPFQTANALANQQIQPLLQGLGIGTSPRAQRLQRQIESGRARGPLADAIRSIQQFAPNVLPSAQALGERLAGQGEQAVQGLQAAITQAQAQMPQYQQAGIEGLDAARQQLQGARSLYEQAQGQLPGLQAISQQGTAGAQSALDLARQYTGGPAITGAEAQLARARQLLGGGPAETGAGRGLELAQRYAEQAASPIGGEDLYQAATRRVLQQVRPGLAARGLEAGGAGAQAETDVLRDMALQARAQQAGQRQQTLQGLQAAAQGLGGLQTQAQQNVGAAAQGLGGLQQTGLAGLGQAATGLPQAAANQSALGQTMLPYLQAVQQGTQGIGQAAQTGAGLAMTGPQLAQQQAGAVQQLGQALSQRFGIPMQQAGALLNLLTAGQTPGLQLTQATAPVGVPSSKGFNVL